MKIHIIVFIVKNINQDKLIGLGNLKFSQFFVYLEYFFSELPDYSQVTINNILDEEFSSILQNKIGCPPNNFEILIFNLYPFLDYPFNLQTQHIVLNELIYTVKNIFEKNNYKLDKTFHRKFINKIWHDYSCEKDDGIPFDFIGINISRYHKKSIAKSM